MARRKITETERLNRLLWAEIKKSQALLGEDDHELCAAVGVNCNTFRCGRKQDPGSFRLDDIRRIAQHCGWDDRTVATLLGVTYHGTT